ncbi:MAG TPA: SpoIIE family protein phosphatase [Phycisphaerae bacterium]|nr:SpoIIE family protein phosphatase [Phycisphaerae bacterium]
MSMDNNLTPEMVLNSINEGVYVTDTDRKIVYWGKSAERITGWTAEEVVGKHCHDGVLCHVDKDGHVLCGESYCPLYRSIVTGKSSNAPIVMFAKTKSGSRVPLQVAVSPLRNAAGEVVGGVETFRDLTDEFGDIERAHKIQSLTLQNDLAPDPRIRFATRYVPHDVIGGDYYAIAKLSSDRYGLFLADVMGHGVSAALYTMFLSSLWGSYHHLLAEPARFAQAVGDRLHVLIQEDEPFATGLCGLFDLKGGVLRLVGAGNPPPLVRRADGSWENPRVAGLPLGMFKASEYEETVVPLRGGDCVFFFTDGAIEVADSRGTCLGVEGLKRILREAGYPADGPDFDALETKLLTASDRIRFDDDVTFIDVHMT